MRKPNITLGHIDRGISFEVGADGEVMDTLLAPAKKDLVAGLQFAFDLPYKSFFNVAPLL